jgi:hypothetical protein
MILSITKRYRTGTCTMRQEPETDAIAIDLNPEMTTCVTGSPLEEDHRVIFLKLPPTLEQVPIYG